MKSFAMVGMFFGVVQGSHIDDVQVINSICQSKQLCRLRLLNKKIQKTQKLTMLKTLGTKPEGFKKH